jgi:hypothetical protein
MDLIERKRCCAINSNLLGHLQLAVFCGDGQHDLCGQSILAVLAWILVCFILAYSVACRQVFYLGFSILPPTLLLLWEGWGLGWHNGMVCALFLLSAAEFRLLGHLRAHHYSSVKFPSHKLFQLVSLLYSSKI